METKNKTKKSVEPVEEKKPDKKVKPLLDFNINLEEMVEAGLHFGHRASNVHPKMKPYLFGARNNVYIIDLEKTKEKIEEALNFIYHLILENKTLLLIGTKIQAKKLVESTAKECNLSYVSERWLGGTFTNFETIKKRVDYFKDLEKKKAAGELEKYTKKERADIDKELKDLQLKIGGIKELTQLPEAIFVLDMKKDELAIKEARKKGIKIIAVSDSNTNPDLADYVIPANDDAVSAISYILGKVKEAILKAKSKGKN